MDFSAAYKAKLTKEDCEKLMDEVIIDEIGGRDLSYSVDYLYPKIKKWFNEMVKELSRRRPNP